MARVHIGGWFLAAAALCSGCASPPPPEPAGPAEVQALLSEVAQLRARNHQLDLETELLQAWENRTPTILALSADPGVRFTVVVEQGERRSVVARETRAPWSDRTERAVPGQPVDARHAYFDLSDALRPGRNVIRIQVTRADPKLAASASLWHLRPEGPLRAREATWSPTTPAELSVDFWVSPYAAQAKG